VKRLLFLCSGNYYRSRFAELLFNALAAEAGLDWRADSRGLVVGPELAGVGPIAPVVLESLAARRIRVSGEQRSPLRLQEWELEGVDRVIALCEGEHRPLLERSHPARAAQVEYWQIPDAPFLPVETALAQIEAKVRGLIRDLATA
jgi:protein-tyrosine phosphatase